MIGDTLAPGAGVFNVFDTGTASFLTSGGNIYSPTGLVQPQVDIPSFGLGAGYSTTILVQVRTLGTEADSASVNLNGTLPSSTTELLRESLGGFGGFRIDTLYRFDVVGNAVSYDFNFSSQGTSMSLDRVAVDAFAAVQSPGAVAVGGVAFERRVPE